MPTLITDLTIPAPANPDSIGQRNFWSDYAWTQLGEEFSEPWGGSDALWAGTLLPRWRQMLPCERGLEIGCGMGRISKYLKGWCERLMLVDVTPRCVEVVRREIPDRHVQSEVIDGCSLGMVESGSVDRVFSWEALVYAERETLAALLKEIGRVLKVGGYGFIHHSNLGGCQGVEEQDERAMGRRKSQTGAGFVSDARGAGLRTLSQEFVPFGERTGEHGLIDCFSLVMKTDAGLEYGPRVMTAVDFAQERAFARRVSGLYRVMPAAQ